VYKTTVQQSEVQEFESTGFQDPQAAEETSGRQYYSVDGERRIYIYIYTKFFGGKKFSATRVVFSSQYSQF
jgi:hypothetical protein